MEMIDGLALALEKPKHWRAETYDYRFLYLLIVFASLGVSLTKTRVYIYAAYQTYTIYKTRASRIEMVSEFGFNGLGFGRG